MIKKLCYDKITLAGMGVGLLTNQKISAGAHFPLFRRADALNCFVFCLTWEPRLKTKTIEKIISRRAFATVRLSVRRDSAVRMWIKFVKMAAKKIREIIC